MLDYQGSGRTLLPFYIDTTNIADEVHMHNARQFELSWGGLCESVLFHCLYYPLIQGNRSIVYTPGTQLAVRALER